MGWWKTNRWFSPWRHRILKSKSRGLLNFYLQQVEDDPEINLSTSFQSRSVFCFENTAFWISEFSPCVSPRSGPCLVKKRSLLMIFSSSNISSIRSVYAHIYYSSQEKKKDKVKKKTLSSPNWIPDVFCSFPTAILVFIRCTPIWRLHRKFIKVRGTFGQITLKRCTTQTWDLEKFLMC